MLFYVLTAEIDQINPKDHYIFPDPWEVAQTNSSETYEEREQEPDRAMKHGVFGGEVLPWKRRG